MMSAKTIKNNLSPQKTKKFTVTIEECVSDSFIIEAESKEQAFEIAAKGYDSCKYVLEPGYLLSKKMHVDDGTDDGSCDCDWIEF